MLRKKEQQAAGAYEQQAEREIGEAESFSTLMLRMFRENRLSAVSLAVIALMILAAVLAPALTPYGEKDMDLMNRLQPPSAAHPLGTDEGGRDILTRLLYGSRVSLLVGIVPTLLSMVLAFPSMLLAMVIMYTLGDGLFNVFLTLTLVNWGSVARIARSEALRLKKSGYVEAARSIGVSKWKIMRRHILPNCLPTLIVLFTLNVPSAILTESSLSFLGLGIQPPNASWGLMVNTGRQFLYNAPWLSFVPSAAIMLAVLSFNFLGDGLRDVLDPRQRKQ